MTTAIEISALPMNDYLEQLEPDVVQVKGHRIGLEQGPEMYKTFRDKKDGCIKVVIKP